MGKDYNVLPGRLLGRHVLAGQCVEAAIEKLGGKADDRKALAEALHMVEPHRYAARTVKFDHLGNVVGDFYVRRCEKRSDAPYGLKLWNKTVKTYKNVSQFWNWPEKEYLRTRSIRATIRR